MSHPSAIDTDLFTGFKVSLDHIGKRLDAVDRVEKWLTEVCSDVDELKRGYELPIPSVSGVVPNTTAHTIMPVTNNFNNANEESIVTRLTWGKQMELEDETDDPDSSMDRPSRDKVCLTQVHKSTEKFLRTVFTSVSNAD